MGARWVLPRCSNPKGRCHALPVTGSPHCSRRRTPAAAAFSPGLQAPCSWQSAGIVGLDVFSTNFPCQRDEETPGGAGSWMSVTNVPRQEVFAARKQSCERAVDD